MPPIKIEIEVDAAKGTATINGFSANVVEKVKSMSTGSIGHLQSLEQQVTKGVGGAIGWLAGQFSSLTSGLAGGVSWIAGKLVGLKTLALGALAGWGVATLAADFTSVGGRMEAMQVSLDTLANKGVKWVQEMVGSSGISKWSRSVMEDGRKLFEELNTWALKMPVNTESAIKSYTMMRAMGLIPTIKDMTILVDTTSALGGQSDALEGIARALGQIKTKGKVSAEELMQLAERGIPVYQILADKLHLTADQMNNIGTSGITADQAIAAIMSGLEERFGGQSVKMQSIWQGLMESLRSYWVEFQRLVMGSGLMTWLESKLLLVTGSLDRWAANGQLKAWAQATSDAVVGFLTDVWNEGVELYNWWQQNNAWIAEDFEKIWAWIKYLGSQLNDWLKAHAKEMYDWWLANNADIIEGIKNIVVWVGNAGVELQKWWAADGMYDYQALVWMCGDGWKWIADNIKLTTDYWANFWNTHGNEWQLFKDIVVDISDALINGVGGLKDWQNILSLLTGGYTPQALTPTGQLDGGGSTLLQRGWQSAGTASRNILDFGIPAAFDWAMGKDSFATGTGYVPKSGPYFLHQGEEVTPAAQASRNRTSAVKSSVTFGDINIHLPASAAAQTPNDWRAIVRDYIIPQLKQVKYA